MQRVIVIGNSGSGKSYLARRLGERLSCPVVDLDKLFWEPGGYIDKRPKEIVHAEVAEFARGECWIVEGVFGELARLCFDRADTLIWLDVDWPTCKANLLGRGPQGEQQDEQAAQASCASLVTWASEYWQRDGMRSYAGHAHLYEQFPGDKIWLKSRDEINDFLASVAKQRGIAI